MLEQLRIRNLATIASLTLELAPGLTVLSGETGAGKSILIDALGLLLGTRADPGLIRAGADSADISGQFLVTPDSAAATWLAAQDLLDADEPGVCVLRRVLQAQGRTRAWINGSAVTVAQLRDLGERLVDVFGQNESHSLRAAEVQCALLDSYGRHAGLLQATATAAARWLELEADIERRLHAAARDPAELELLRHEVGELVALRLGEDELERIEAEHRRLAGAGRLIQDGAATRDMLYGADGAVHDQLASALQTLRGLVEVDAGFGEAEQLVASAQAQVREAADTLRRLLDRLDLDPDRLAALDERLAQIHDLARKHRVRAQDLPVRLHALQAALSDSQAAGEAVESLRAEQTRVFAVFRNAAQNLHAARREQAARHAEAVTARVRELGMPDAAFVVVVEPLARSRPHPAGDDEVRFDFSANPGQPPRPLARVASGGELSRVSLALQVVAQEIDGAPTMIFDEVDAGIGGGVAEAVGRQLRQLGERRQVLCVTHLGQVAACGDHHLLVSKRVVDDQTYTEARALDGKARVSELARMIGGQARTTASDALARELLRAGAAR